MQAKKTLILGATTNPDRYAYRAAQMLSEHGHPMVAIGLRPGNVFGVEIQTTPVAESAVDTVTLYLNPERQKAYYDYILSLQPKRVIFNPGTENPELYELLAKHYIEAEVACTLVLLSTGQY